MKFISWRLIIALWTGLPGYALSHHPNGSAFFSAVLMLVGVAAFIGFLFESPRR